MPVPAACARCRAPLPEASRRLYCAACGAAARTDRNRANQQAQRARRLAAKEGSMPAAPVAGLSGEQAMELRAAVKALRKSARDLTRAQAASVSWIPEVDPHLLHVKDVLRSLAALLPEPPPTPRKDRTS